MSSVDDVWASMRQAGPPSMSVSSILQKAALEKKKKDAKRSAQKRGVLVPLQHSKSADSGSAQHAPQEEEEEVQPKAVTPTRESIDTKTMLLKIGRNVEVMTNSEDVAQRKQAMTTLYRVLFEESTMVASDYSIVFRDVAKPIFKRFSDPVEKCRELAFKLTRAFFENASDLILVLGYFIPALMQRVPAGMAFDEDMKVFVMDMETHEAYRRGKAVDRQDRGDSLQTLSVVETSEELRLLGCSVLSTLITKLCGQGAASVLHPYFYEIVMFLQAQLRDPFPDVKIDACHTLDFMSTIEEFNTGMKFFAVGLVRAILPVVRHKHAKVRVAAVSALKSCMAIPDRAKCRGAGTEAIPDLVGFREENVLNIAAFYKSDVQINHLAELVQDKSIQVREKLADMLTVLLTEIGDRYDHQTRLLPYLLDLLTDESSSVADASMRCLKICGKQYEDEHQDDIIERRQYGVDGDNRINLDKPLPVPFTERPRLGMRLYVRGNTKRFLTALVNELTNWVSQTRIKSANLLKVIVVLCEEHITMEAHTLLPSFIKALGFSKDDGDGTLHGLLLEVYELVGRYVLPDTYIHYILPRLNGDPTVVQFGVDVPTRVSVIEFLGALLSGSKSNEVIPHFESLASALTDPFVIHSDSTVLVGSAMEVVLTLLRTMRGKGNAAIQAHFLATGRLTNLKGTITRLFSWFMRYLNDSTLCKQALEGIFALSILESDSGSSADRTSVGALFDSHCQNILSAAASAHDFVSNAEGGGNSEHKIFSILAESPFHSVIKQRESLTLYLEFVCSSAEKLLVGGGGGVDDQQLLALQNLLVSAISPVSYVSYPSSNPTAWSHLTTKLKAAEGESSNGLDLAVGGGKNPMKQFIIYGIASDDDRKVCVDTTRQFLGRVMDSFVLNQRWAQMHALQSARLDVLKMLLGLESSHTESFDGLDHILRGGDLTRAFPDLVVQVLDCARLPANPLKIRLSAVEIVGRAFTVMIQSWYGQVDFSSMLKSYAYWGSKGLEERAAQLGERSSTQSRAQAGITMLVGAMDDSSDEVRMATLVALRHGVALVFDDTKIASQESTSTIGFEKLCARLLLEAGVISNSTAFLEMLNHLLRSLAVLSPGALKVLLRRQLEEMKSFTVGSPSLQLISDIFDHCEILCQLSGGPL